MIRVLIMGAAGRDFHDFNVYFRDNSAYEVVAFTATQIPGIQNRRYPSQLAGPRYPDGIPIEDESQLNRLIRELAVDQVVFAYSDIPHTYVMHRASQVLAAGADFRLLGTRNTMLKSSRPVISVCAVRTGCGKSQTSRHVAAELQAMGLRVVAVRHPMPYGNLSLQGVQRFADYADLDANDCTIEEREEYEPFIDREVTVYAGVDYEAILGRAEREADVIVWDGGNNDLPFFAPDLHIVVTDPHRPGHELSYYPGESNLRLADVAIINKVDSADYADIQIVRDNIRRANPSAVILEAASPLFVDHPEVIRGRRVLVVEDGPTVTHGGMSCGAGYIAAQRFGAAEIVDPRPFAIGSIADVYAQYAHIGPVLPAMGYGTAQMRDLEQTIDQANADLVLAATPIDLRRVISVGKPIERVRYELQIIGAPTLAALMRERLGRFMAV